MGSPIIFNGKYAKLLTNKSILNSDGSLLQYDGEKNYIPYAQFEQNVTTGWSLFNTTLTSGLPTGTVGVGAASLALSTTSTNPIAGSFSLQVAAGTAWTAGQGVISSAFTVDRADLGKVLTFKLYYEAASGGANANWSGILGSQTLAVYLYDVTAAAWVQPAGFLGMNQNSGAGYVTGTFQTSVTSGQQYRLSIIALQATTLPITLTLDQVSVGPQTAPIGPVVTDWVSYTPTTFSAGFGTVSGPTFYWRRSGKNMEILGSFQCGTVAASLGYFSLPNGLQIDTSIVGSNISLGKVEVQNSSSTLFHANALYSTVVGTGFVTLTAQTSTNGGFAVAINANAFLTNSSFVNVLLTFPVAGWSSTTQMSNDTDTRVVAFSVGQGFTQAVNTTPVKLPYTAAATIDTHGSYSTTNSNYTVPVSGIYRVDLAAVFTSGTGPQVAILNIFKNSSGTSAAAAFQMAASSTTYYFSAQRTLSLNAGDVIDVRAYVNTGTATVANDATANIFSLNRLSGPSVIAATETVACEYNTSAGNSIPASTNTFIDYGNKITDTHNAVLGAGSGNNSLYTNTWRYVVPVSGRYLISSNLCIVNAITTAAMEVLVSIFVDNAAQRSGSRTPLPTTSSAGVYACNVVSEIKLNAGQIISIGAFQSNAGSTARNQEASAISNHISIVRVGN